MSTIKRSSSCPCLQKFGNPAQQVQVQLMQIDNNNVEVQQAVEPAINPDYEYLKIEVMDLFRMLKLTEAGNQHLIRALQINPALTQLQQIHNQVQQEVVAQLQQELDEFEQSFLFNVINFDEAIVPFLPFTQ